LAALGVFVLMGMAVLILPRLLSDQPSPGDEEIGLPILHLTDMPSEVVVSTATEMAFPTETPTETPLPTQVFVLEVVGKWQTSREARDVFVQDDIAYIANGEDGLRILDVSDLSNPSEIGSFDLKMAVSVIVVEGVAYVVGEGQIENNRLVSDQVIIIDVSDPTVPKLLGEVTPEAGFFHRNLSNLAVSEDVVYLTTSNQLIAIDTSNPSIPVELGAFSFFSNVASPGVFFQDGIAYMQANNFHVVDFRDLAEPEEIGGFNAEMGSSVEVVDQVAYIVGWDTGLTILDVSEPARPIKLGQFLEFIGNYDLLPRGAASRQTFMAVSVSGDVAYMSFRFGIDQGTYIQSIESGILAIDISDSTEPVLLEKFAEFEQVSSLFAVDDAVFVTDRTRGLFILSMSQ
jgi:hypothetical protein